MTKPKRFDLIQADTARAGVFPWELVDHDHHQHLKHDALVIDNGRRKEVDALLEQAWACWDAKRRLRGSYFSSWVETETCISRRTAYRLVKVWERVGMYHYHAWQQDEPSPLRRFDYGTILYVFSDESLCPNLVLDALLRETYLLLERGEALEVVSRRHVLESVHRKKMEDLDETGKALKQPDPARLHLSEHYRDAERDDTKLDGATLPPLDDPLPDTLTDEHGNTVPESLREVFGAREHFARLRREVTELARQVHALTHSDAGKDLHRSNVRKLLAIAEDLNLSCPALVEENVPGSHRNWASAKVLINRTYHRNYRKHGPVSG